MTYFSFGRMLLSLNSRPIEMTMFTGVSMSQLNVGTKDLSRGVQNTHKYSQAGIMLKCKTPKQMRLENSLGHLPNFAAIINQEYCHMSPYRTWTNCFFKHFSGRHKSIFMATLGRCSGRLANMKIKSSLGCHLAMLSCVKS